MNGSISPELQRQADHDLARRSVPGVFAYLLLWAIIVGFGDFDGVNATMIWVTGGVYGVLALFRLLLVVRFEMLYARSAFWWRRLCVAGALMSGLAWGLFCAYMLWTSGLGASSLLVLMSSAGIAAGAAVALAPVGGVMIFMLALLLWPSIPVGLLIGNTQGEGVALMFLVYFIFLSLTTRRLNVEYWRGLYQGEEMAVLAGEAERSRRLHAAVGGVLNQYVRDIDPRTVFDTLLKQSIELTGSEYGFIGEVLRDHDGKPYLKTYALTDISWNEEWKKLYDQYASQGMEFRNLNTLFGAALATGQAVISNDPAHDPRRGGLPPGHPALKAFLGVPLYLGEHMVGMIGLANRVGGYDQAMVDFMQPMFSTCAQIIESRRAEAARRQARHEQKEASTQMRAILDTVVDGIITINEHGLVETFNPAAEHIFGYRAEEVIGNNVNMLMPEPYRSAHDSYLGNYLAGGEKRVIGIGREVMGLRKNGSTFPLDLAVSETVLEGRRVFTGLVRDITERKKAQQALSQFKGTLDRALDCVFMFTPDTLRFFYVNQGAMDQVGYSEQELMSMHPYDIKPSMGEAKFREFIAPMLHGERNAVTFEIEHQHKDGHLIPVEIFLQYVAPPGEQARFVAIVRDITERKKVERLKSEFVSTVSHELRTPLTSIRGALGLVTSGVTGNLPDKARELLEIAYKNSDRLTQLINDILDIEKIESGRMQFMLRAHSLRRLVEQSLVVNKAYGEQYSVAFRLPSGADAIVSVDADRFMQVMSNLLSNASKFSPANSEVEVSIENLGAVTRVAVRDRGPGIPQDFQARIFQKFSQADSSDTRAKGGTGLGLSITKAIIEQFGGSIGFSTGTDGTTFYFDLPQLEPELRTAASPGIPRVLVCEDDPDAARLIAMMLDHAGFAADVVFNAAQAREALASGAYQAMTLDLLLPDESGVELVRSLREDERTRFLPIVVVSAIAEQGRAQLNGGFGIVDWLSKPIDESRLASAMELAAAGSGGYRPQVLHVEDDADVQQVVATLGADVADFDPADTLEMARSKLALQRYALIVLDISLPDGSGWDLLPTIRALDQPPPVLVFAGNKVGEENLRHVEAALVKAAASNEEIVRTIRNLLRKSGVSSTR